MVLARATDGLGPINVLHSNLLAKLFTLMEPRLLAQGSAASGVLTLDDGTTVSLTGTYNSGSYQLSSNSGYSMTASVSDGSLSGTITTPRGIGTVTPLAYAAPASPPPADPTGVYSGTYQIGVDGYFNNVRVSTGAFTRSCGFRVVVTGTLTLTVLRQQDAGGRVVHLADDWRETLRVVAPCPGGADLSEHVVTPRGPLGLTYFGDVTKIVLGVTDQGDHDGGFGIRTVAFLGGLGGTTVEGRLVKSSRFSSLVANGTEEHREGYPRTETNVTLVKR